VEVPTDRALQAAQRLELVMLLQFKKAAIMELPEKRVLI
jgi:hypothetical protein